VVARKRSKRARGASLRVGDRVSFEFGAGTVKGVIIEDRGKLGFKGAQLFTVRVKRTDAEDLVLEIAADRLNAA